MIVDTYQKMHLDSHLPAALLQPFVRNYLVIESQEELVNKILPDTSLVIAFRYKGQINYVTGNSRNGLPITVISGLRKSARLINYTNNTGNILVIFKEAGAAAFFREPLHELFEESVSLDHFVAHQKIALIEEQLAGAQNNHQRIAIVEQFLLSKLNNAVPDKLITAAIQKITATKGIVKIKELADTLYISQDAFEKRFRKIAGTSPKQFSSIVRMKSIIGQDGQNQTLTDRAFGAGYFDQPHFIKDFKLFTGQTPTAFFNSPSFW
jgi:AraC-like DNA-binding protein